MFQLAPLRAVSIFAQTKIGKQIEGRLGGNVWSVSNSVVNQQSYVLAPFLCKIALTTLEFRNLYGSYIVILSTDRKSYTPLSNININS